MVFIIYFYITQNHYSKLAEINFYFYYFHQFIFFLLSRTHAFVYTKIYILYIIIVDKKKKKIWQSKKTLRKIFNFKIKMMGLFININ